MGAPTARAGQMDRFFLQKRLCTYKWSVKKQKTGRKTGKNPPKKVIFPAPPASWLSLAGYGPTISGLAGYGLSHFKPGRIWSGPYPVRPDMVGPYPAKLSQLAGGAGKNTFFGGFLLVFRPVFCFFIDSLYMTRIFWRKKSDLACFFWPQGPLIQSSAAPQGPRGEHRQLNK